MRKTRVERDQSKRQIAGANNHCATSALTGQKNQNPSRRGPRLSRLRLRLRRFL